MTLETKEGALRFCELRRREMVGCFERLGQFERNGYSFCAYVFATHELRLAADPTRLDGHKPGPKLPQVEAKLVELPPFIQKVLPPSQHTEFFSHTLKMYGKVTRAIGVLIMSETWHVAAAFDGRSAEEIRGSLPNDLADAPGRGEQLFMQLEHSATGRRIWTAQIQRDPTRLQAWKESDMDVAKGRLVDLVDWRS